MIPRNTRLGVGPSGYGETRSPIRKLLSLPRVLPVLICLLAGCSSSDRPKTYLGLLPSIPVEMEARVPPSVSSIQIPHVSLRGEDWWSVSPNHTLPLAQFHSYLEWAREATISQANETRFSAWEINPLLHSLCDAYLLTSDLHYLNEFQFFADYFLSLRANVLNRPFFDGGTPSQWARLPKYDIFHVSPYHEYPTGDRAELSALRGWVSLDFSDINYSGLILDPLLRFALLVSENRLSDYSTWTKHVVEEVQRVVESHNPEWREEEDDSGYYSFAPNAPFFLDGVEIPINEAAPFGTTLVRLFLLTGTEAYLNRADRMWRHWNSALLDDPYGYIAYPYTLGNWFLGWHGTSSPSVNSTDVDPNHAYETFHKAALTLKFLSLLDVARERRGLANSLVGIFEDFLRVLLASKNLRTPISPFPSSFSFGWPKDVYHSVLPFSWSGWSLVMANDDELSRILLLYSMNPQALSAQEGPRVGLSAIYALRSSGQTEDFTIQEEQLTIRPTIIEDSNREETPSCLVEKTYDAVGYMEFHHITPKHNRLFLYVNQSLDHRLRLEIDPDLGYFTGRIFIPAGECIRLNWDPGDDPLAAPGSDLENQVLLTLHSIHSSP